MNVSTRVGAHESSDQIEHVCMNGSDVWHGGYEVRIRWGRWGRWVCRPGATLPCIDSRSRAAWWQTIIYRSLSHTGASMAHRVGNSTLYVVLFS